MRILFVGDVVGSPGRGMIQQYVPALKKKYTPTVTIINGKRSRWPWDYRKNISKLLECGAQAVTLETTLGIIVKYLNSSMMQNIFYRQPANFQKELREKDLSL